AGTGRGPAPRRRLGWWRGGRRPTATSCGSSSPGRRCSCPDWPAGGWTRPRPAGASRCRGRPPPGRRRSWTSRPAWGGPGRSSSSTTAVRRRRAGPRCAGCGPGSAPEVRTAAGQAPGGLAICPGGSREDLPAGAQLGDDLRGYERTAEDELGDDVLTVEVAAPGGDEAQFAGPADESFDHVRRVRAVVALQADQAGLDESWQEALGFR